MPYRPARALQLSTADKAAVYRWMQPFTIILKDHADGEVQDEKSKLISEVRPPG